jgi:phage shock protein A
MEKQTIIGRIGQMAKADINSLIDSAEDPQKMLDQLVRDYSNNINEAEGAIAITIGNVRLAEEDARQDDVNAADWGGKAAAASHQADGLRLAGKALEADKFDSLAKVALSKQIQSESASRSARPHLASQNEMVDKLKTGLVEMKEKLTQLMAKRDELNARAKTAQAQTEVHDALASVNVLDPTSELGRFEEKVRREEARAQGQNELDASSLDSQFENLEDLTDQSEVDARLASLKAGGSNSAIVGASN